MRLGYLTILVGIILIITIMTVPSLFFPKCKVCGQRNLVGKVYCKSCKNKIELDYVAMIEEKDEHNV